MDRIQRCSSKTLLDGTARDPGVGVATVATQRGPCRRLSGDGMRASRCPGGVLGRVIRPTPWERLDARMVVLGRSPSTTIR